MVKTIAFYLPQFHPIPENDAWWGEGFTEWVNVKSAASQFPGHYQPHIPAKPLGYYDLRNVSVQQYQAGLAKKFGIHAFCYYYYWFNGKKVLDTPINNILATDKVKFPFCLCWANGNWTRAWYGQNKQILMSQDYVESNIPFFCRDIAPFLSDERYLKIHGRPLLCIYVVENIPDAKRYTDAIRNELTKMGLPEPWIARVEALQWDTHPSDYGCDYAIEFAPDWRMLGPLINAPGQPRRASYRNTITNMMLKATPSYKRWRCIFPSWDNTPRYKSAAMIIENDSLTLFKCFVDQSISHTCKNFEDDERLLFVNAWNEWGEGCHLEPDERYGTTWLQIISRSLFENASHG